MPSAKKRRGDVPRQTLHDFFSSKSLPVIKSESSNTAQPTSTRASSHREIIIIDSDSDEEPEFVASTNAKRRKLSPKNVHTSSKVKVDNPVASVNVTHRSKENASIPNQTPSGNSANDTSVTGDPLCFGKPYLLMSDSSPIITEPKGFPSFGQPFLLRGPSQRRSEETGCNQNLAPRVASTSQIESAVDIDLTLDDWENGDDEVIPEVAVDDDLDLEWVSYEESQNKSTSMSLCGSSPAKYQASGLPHGLPPETSTPSTLVNPRASLPSEPDCPTDKTRANESNAFAFLMSSFKENEIWKEATVAEGKTFLPQKSKGGRRKAPFYKVLQGMPIAVDAFNYGMIPGVTAYFLTHAHSDHYTNLSSSWKNGPIYCSQGTANLIIHMLSVDRKWVHPLPMDVPSLIPNTDGVTVTLIEANHCPGSCLFFFEGRQTINAGDSTFKSSFIGSSKTFRYLHCGDFRASPKHILHPAVKGKAIDHVYLDTTYLDPKYTFPPQPMVISACAELTRRIVHGQLTKDKKSTVLAWMTTVDPKGKAKEQSKILIVIGTYSIGKERIAKAIAQALDTKIYCDARKTAILKCQDDPELHGLLTSDPMEGLVHLVPLSTISTDRLKIYLERFQGHYDRVIGFRPTGWTYTPAAGTNLLPSISSILSSASTRTFTFADLELSKQSTSTLQLYPVPYSEHSSFHELTCFSLSFSWVKMIATVNVGSERSRGKMAKWVSKWEAERKKRGNDAIVPHRHPDYW
ncbi:hypothetical protein GALMADRAFT_240985 [Galerina marginata CBS 339.88]|uniref:DNA repair metallo-beta-lactamase domain-containing protein n=1 Tax=Galerina marginata (strain CBS 339.88) TaxID=685588 RepID=A0A067TE55_GALM3|nr:hypothetical protein GALMADRAFT_240985 [Galerina marginata CBS 339.88]